MRFVRTVMEKAGIRTAYGLGKRLRETINKPVATQLVDTWLEKIPNRTPEGMKLKFLCGLRKLSGLSWGAFGRMLDEEFLEEKEK